MTHRTYGLAKPFALCLLAAAPGFAGAASAGDWIVRGGATWVVPNEDTGGASGPRASDGTLDGSEVAVGDDVMPGLTIAYMVTDNIAVELLGALPFKHRLEIDGGALDGAHLGDIKHLPPALNVQYHFETTAPVSPYVGAGFNYTIFFDEEVGGDAEGVGVRGLDLEDSFGLSAQVGVDFYLNEHWLINLDSRYLGISTTATVQMDDGPTRVDVDIDPWVASVSVGYRF